MAAETGFDIDGTVYEVPALETLNMDEAQVLYDYSGLTMEDFVSPPDESEEERTDRERRQKNPGLIRALMHIAYQRGNPKVKATTVRELIGKAKVIEALLSLADDEPEDGGGADVPPAPTSEPGSPSPTSSLSKTSTSSPDSTPDSDERVVPLERIGIGR